MIYDEEKKVQARFFRIFYESTLEVLEQQRFYESDFPLYPKGRNLQTYRKTGVG